MVLQHTFKIDHPLFQDWSVEIDVDQFADLSEVLDSFKNLLIECLDENHFSALRNIGQALELKIINIDNIAQLKQNAPGQLFIISEIY